MSLREREASLGEGRIRGRGCLAGFSQPAASRSHGSFRELAPHPLSRSTWEARALEQVIQSNLSEIEEGRVGGEEREEREREREEGERERGEEGEGGKGK